jgi:hypothetical protein
MSERNVAAFYQLDYEIEISINSLRFNIWAPEDIFFEKNSSEKWLFLSI